MIRDPRANFTSIAREKGLIALALDDYFESPQYIANFLQIDCSGLSAMAKEILTAPPAIE